MSWISGNCQDDRNFSCYYETFGEWVCDAYGCEYVIESWCVDSDEPCYSVNDGGYLTGYVDHRQPQGGGGW
ncbi:hypothetical protein [Flavihumibacter petaseus]|uniref:Uncharacterized protein n=1 Tax=Flavihumibacter petaseus NBRC 106054 TaxID=1220578 RepID=A0A0E9N6U1_9BACT|nr:hypothetical protein [Flavihumibacter petaseus]GAO45411.1 hypothetical protein FPE01S_05_01060 [Flavihumibacter petaseus NBRC 106054]